MSRPLACSVLFVLLHIAPLNLAPAAAQEPERWGDELPPRLSSPRCRSRRSSIRCAGRRHRCIAGRAGACRIRERLGVRRAVASATSSPSPIAPRSTLFVIDVKDDTGYLTYRSSVPTAVQIGANQQLRARDTESTTPPPREHGIHPIARIVVAKDPLLASRKPEWSVRQVERRSLAGSTGLRLGRCLQRFGLDLRGPARGRGGAHGLRRGAVRLRALPRRAREPPGHRRLRRRREGETKRQGVDPQSPPPRRPHPTARRAVHPSTFSGSRPAPGPTWGSGSTGRISSPPPTWCCRWSTPATMSAGSTTSSVRTTSPTSSSAGRCRTPSAARRPLGKTAEVRPYLQAFTLGSPRYTPALVREQIRAAEELGLKSWALWNPRSAYDQGIFRPEPAAVGMTAEDDRASDSGTE
jgi:hypothetical protein